MGTLVATTAQRADLKFADMTVYTGRVTVYEDGRYLYSHSTGITCLTKSDALQDAEVLKADLLRDLEV